MCYNGSENTAPQLHAVLFTWSSCDELLVQRMFIEIAADLGLTIFGGNNTTDAYAHYSTSNET